MKLRLPTWWLQIKMVHRSRSWARRLPLTSPRRRRLSLTFWMWMAVRSEVATFTTQCDKFEIVRPESEDESDSTAAVRNRYSFGCTSALFAGGDLVTWSSVFDDWTLTPFLADDPAFFLNANFPLPLDCSWSVANRSSISLSCFESNNSDQLLFGLTPDTGSHTFENTPIVWWQFLWNAIEFLAHPLYVFW